jgi:hypothetical protein
MLQDGSGLVDLTEFPSLVDKHRDTPIEDRDDFSRCIGGIELKDMAQPDRDAHAVVQLPGGSDILVWKGTGYKRCEGEFVPAYKLGNPTHGWASLPIDADRFFCTMQDGWKNTRLFEVRCETDDPIMHLPTLINLRSLAPGPSGSVLIKEGHNKLGDLGKLYFRHENCYVRIEPELFEDEDPQEIRSLHWAEKIDRLLAATPNYLWSVPMERVLHLPRYNAMTGRIKP